ncbi:MAG: sigma 54-interacting transcriptional regulator [Bacteriovoracia bacterium]
MITSIFSWFAWSHQTYNSPNNPCIEALQDAGFLTNSRALLDTLSGIDRVASFDVPVLITGETGTGKEMLANAIHRLSGRKGPFVAVNLSAIPESLRETTLFGHEKGSYTGAERQHKGLFEQAHGGTLLLDEIGDSSELLQLALLRVLETKKVRRIGAVGEIPIDVRVIAATNKDVRSLARNGKFRTDLLFRLDVVPFELPPLRERPEDIPALARHFIKEFAEKNGREIRHISPDAQLKLMTHFWSGNIRELRNTIERAYILAQGQIIGRNDIYLRDSLSKSEAVNSGSELRDKEDPSGYPSFKTFFYAYIRLAKEEFGVALIAKHWQMNRRTLYRNLLRPLSEADAPDTGTWGQSVEGLLTKLIRDSRTAAKTYNQQEINIFYSAFLATKIDPEQILTLYHQ